MTGATALSAALEQNNSLRMLSIANNGLQTKVAPRIATSDAILGRCDTRAMVGSDCK